MEMRAIILLTIGAVIAVVLIPTLWDAVWVDTLYCLAWNDSEADTGTDCHGNALDGTDAKHCMRCINGSSETLLKLVPLIFVGAIVIGGILLSIRKNF